MSCKKNFQLSNHEERTVDSVNINLDTIRMLNFNNYFSKIEITPLSQSYDDTINNFKYKSRSLLIDNKLQLSVSSNNMEREDTIFFTSIKENKILDSIIISCIDNYITVYFPYFSSIDNRFFVHPGLSNELYQIDTKEFSLSPVVVADYGKKNLTSEIIKSRGKRADYQLLEGGHYAVTVNIFQNSKYYLIESWYLQHTFLTFYDSQSKQTRTGIDYFSNGIVISDEEFFFPKIQKITDEALYLMVRDYRINSVIDTVYLTEDSKKQLANLKKENNAVIVKYYFK